MKNYCLWCHQADSHPVPPLTSQSVPAPNVSINCPDCLRPIVLIDVSAACSLARKSRKTIYEWIHTGRLRTLRLADDRNLIVYSSLFRPPAEEPPLSPKPT